MSLRSVGRRSTSTAHGAASGLGRLLGFGINILFLAVAALVAIPEMVRASSPEAMAAILAGQAIGAVAAVLIHYGWAVTGPARVARGNRADRLRDYLESVTVRSMLFVPVAAAAAVLAAVAAPAHHGLAALGALSAASIGFTANWYFAGLGRPYLMLILETIPRVAGTVIGIVLMSNGSGAAAGLWGQVAGMFAGFAVSSAWVVLVGGRPAGWFKDRASTSAVLRSQWTGVIASSIPAVYAALPIVMVGFLNPAVQPAFAILDKFSKQATAALSPIVTVLQGWVPAATGEHLKGRTRKAIIATSAFCVALTLGIVIAGGALIDWLSAGRIPVPEQAVALAGAGIAAGLLGSVICVACLVAVGRIRYMASITAISSAVGLALVALLTPPFGVVGAVSAILLGNLLKVVLGLWGLRGSPLESPLARPESAASPSGSSEIRTEIGVGAPTGPGRDLLS